MARPRNTERMSPQAQRQKAREVCSDALDELKKKVRQAGVGELTAIVTKLLPLVMNEETQTQADATMELLAQKALRVKIRIREANEQNLKQEAIEEVDETPDTTEEDDDEQEDEESEEYDDTSDND